MANSALTTFVRSARLILWAPVLLLTAATSSHSSVPIGQALQLGLALALAMSFGFILNDFCDVKTDEGNGLNKLNRLQPHQRRQAMLLAGVLPLAGIMLASGSGLRGIMSLAVIILLLIAYSLWARPKLLVANILAALLTASPILLPLIVFEIPFDSELIGIALGATFIAVGREIIFDIEDMRGDKISGRSTFPILCGVPASLRWSLCAQAIGVCLVVLPLYSSMHELGAVSISCLFFLASMSYALFAARRAIRREGDAAPEYTTWTRIAMLVMSAIIYAS